MNITTNPVSMTITGGDIRQLRNTIWSVLKNNLDPDIGDKLLLIVDFREGNFLGTLHIWNLDNEFFVYTGKSNFGGGLELSEFEPYNDFDLEGWLCGLKQLANPSCPCCRAQPATQDAVDELRSCPVFMGEQLSLPLG
jgi:hypothetical protein